MIKRYPYEQLGHANHGWLDTRHHFSFGTYRDPARVHFGALRVINDDRIAANSGFQPHPHRDMEIITYVRAGAISHEDNLGNKGRTATGDVQVMSAGTGVVHAEYNREPVETVLYQIWIVPHTMDVKPRWKAAQFPKTPAADALKLLVSGRPEDADKGALFIYQDAAIYGGRLNMGAKVVQPIKHQAYVLACEGSITINGTTLKQGDGAEVSGEQALAIEAHTSAEVLVIDVPVMA